VSALIGVDMNTLWRPRWIDDLAVCLLLASLNDLIIYLKIIEICIKQVL
jgi:hypothetical protein